VFKDFLPLKRNSTPTSGQGTSESCWQVVFVWFRITGGALVSLWVSSATCGDTVWMSQRKHEYDWDR